MYQHNLFNKRNHSFQSITEAYLFGCQKQRRKSCCCEDCGKLSSTQYKFMNYQPLITQHYKKKLQKHFSIESTCMDSNDTHLTSKVSILKIHHIRQETLQVKQYPSTQQNQSFTLQNQYNYQKKQRCNSCYCDMCGINSKKQQQTKSIFIENKTKQRSLTFRIKRNLDQIFRGISPIEKKLIQEQEEDENNPLNYNQLSTQRRSLIQPIKVSKLNGRKFFIKEHCKTKTFFKTNSNSRELSQKADSNSPIGVKKCNLPVVKSSYAKTREILNIYEVQHSKYTQKINNVNP